MEIKIAKNSGYCFGVKRALKITEQILKENKEKDVKIIDTTCPFVKKAQARAGELSHNGYFVIIIGNKTHPEVMGIKDYILNENYTVIENKADIERLPEKDKIGIVVQTTQILDRLIQISGKSLKKTKELIIYITICNKTRNRQNFTGEME